MFKYAHVENNIVIGTQESTNEVISVNLIQVDVYPELQSTYNNGIFTAPVVVAPVVLPIRKISTGSMQKRFAMSEEVLILDGTDTTAKVIRERLFNSAYADLDFQELIDGVTYLVTLFVASGNYAYTVTERVAVLLQDGTQDEEV